MDLSNFCIQIIYSGEKIFQPVINNRDITSASEEKKGVSPQIISFLPESSTTAALGRYGLINHLHLTVENHNNSAHVVG